MRKIFLIISICLVPIFGCTGEKNKEVEMEAELTGQGQNIDTLSERIDLMLEELKDWDPEWQNYQSFSTRTGFRIIYSHPEIYGDSVVRRFISDSSYKHRIICLFSLQKISDADYYKFADTCVSLYLQGRLQEDVLYILIKPIDYINGYRFVLNSKDERVINIISRLKKSDVTSGSLLTLCKQLEDGVFRRVAEGVIATPGNSLMYPNGLK